MLVVDFFKDFEDEHEHEHEHEHEEEKSPQRVVFTQALDAALRNGGIAETESRLTPVAHF